MASNLTDPSTFHSFEAVDRVSEAQLQMSDKLSQKNFMIKGLTMFRYKIIMLVRETDILQIMTIFNRFNLILSVVNLLIFNITIITSAVVLKALSLAMPLRLILSVEA